VVSAAPAGNDAAAVAVNWSAVPMRPVSSGLVVDVRHGARSGGQHGPRERLLPFGHRHQGEDAVAGGDDHVVALSHTQQ
jgi:hypothetical protein